ncbi:MAG TPA: hypothetical protein VF606_10660 [Geminicoccaceae bacterium]
MSRIRNIIVALLALATIGAGFAAAPAHAGYRAALRDCSDDGVLQGNHSRRDLQEARRNLPSDLREYSDCDAVLARAALRATQKGAGGRAGNETPPGGGTPELTTPSGAIASNPQQYDELKRQQRQAPSDAAPEKVSVGGKPVRPGTSGLASAAARTAPNSLPAPFVAALIALGVLGLLTAALLLRHRWPETRSAALRILRR